MQLEYGDDGLDPVAMEAGEGRPLDLPRCLALVRATTPRGVSSAAAAPPPPPAPLLPQNAAEDGARTIFAQSPFASRWHQDHVFLFKPPTLSRRIQGGCQGTGHVAECDTLHRLVAGRLS